VKRESSAPEAAARRTAAMVTPNMFKDAPSDSAAIQSAVDLAASRGEPVLIPALNERTGASLWVISETIGLPSGMTLYLDNCRLRMADGVFCNCLSNAKAWIPARGDPANEEHDIHIVGIGNAVLDGGEFNGWGERTRPGGAFQEDVRAHVASLPKSLVHNCPIYFHNVRRFSIRGVKIYHQRYWGMCFSVCSEGEIRDIAFEADFSWVSADGKTRDPKRRPVSYANLWVKNGDGIDLRAGCHDILIENISGFTEDDTVALTNVPMGRTAKADAVEGMDPDIHHVTIRNVRAWCWCSMNLVRILGTDGGKVHDVTIDGVYEMRPPDKDWRSGSAIQINDSRDEYRYNKHPETSDTRNISIANVSSCSGAAIRVFEGVENLRIENVTATDGAETALLVKDHTTFRNCSIRGIKCTPTARIGSVIDLHEAHGDLLVSGVEACGARHVLRLSDSDIDVTLENDKVEKLAGERIVRLERGDPDCGPHQPDLDSRIPE
jgi:polygalacturonase